MDLRPLVVFMMSRIVVRFWAATTSMMAMDRDGMSATVLVFWPRDSPRVSFWSMRISRKALIHDVHSGVPFSREFW